MRSIAQTLEPSASAFTIATRLSILRTFATFALPMAVSVLQKYGIVNSFCVTVSPVRPELLQPSFVSSCKQRLKCHGKQLQIPVGKAVSQKSRAIHQKHHPSLIPFPNLQVPTHPEHMPQVIQAKTTCGSLQLLLIVTEIGPIIFC